MTMNPLDKCNRCGVAARPPRWDRPGITLTRHHIIPKREGGSNRKENIEILCWPCHAAHHQQENAEYIELPKDERRRLAFQSLGPKLSRLVQPRSTL